MRFLNDWLLTILLLVPATGGAAVLFVRSARAVRRTSIGVALSTFCLSLLILIPFRRQQGTEYDYAPAGTVQMLRSMEVIPSLHASYRVAVDGLSLPFVVLTTFLCAILSSVAPAENERTKSYYAMLLWLEASTLGAFVAFDLLLLWAFLALMLAPCCGLIWLTAGRGRARATIALLAPMLIALACLFVASMGERLMSNHCLAGGTLDLVRLAACHAGSGARSLFVLALIGFAIRLPVVPFHSWLAVIATETSPAVAAAIGAFIPLTGGYGLFRVVLPLFPAASASLWWVMAVLGLLTVFYHSLAAIGQPRLRRSVVHLSVAMMGFVLIGAAMFTVAGVNGAVFTSLTGSLAGAMLLLLAGTAGDARGPEIASRSGSAWAAAFTVGMLTLLAIPGFLGQVAILLGAFQALEQGSTLLRSRAASPGVLIAVSGAVCAAVFLFGLACVQTMRALSIGDRSGASLRPNEAATSRVAMEVVVPLAAVAVLFGVFAGPCCFAFTRRAIGVLIGIPP
jgi:NADH:ubiquinone oxidoreductase subunit 4 (subunit M)